MIGEISAPLPGLGAWKRGCNHSAGIEGGAAAPEPAKECSSAADCGVLHVLVLRGLDTKDNGKASPYTVITKLPAFMFTVLFLCAEYVASATVDDSSHTLSHYAES